MSNRVRRILLPFCIIAQFQCTNLQFSQFRPCDTNTNPNNNAHRGDVKREYVLFIQAAIEQSKHTHTQSHFDFKLHKRHVGQHSPVLGCLCEIFILCILVCYDDRALFVYIHIYFSVWGIKCVSIDTDGQQRVMWLYSGLPEECFVRGQIACCDFRISSEVWVKRGWLPNRRTRNARCGCRRQVWQRICWAWNVVWLYVHHTLVPQLNQHDHPCISKSDEEKLINIGNGNVIGSLRVHFDLCIRFRGSMYIGLKDGFWSINSLFIWWNEKIF